MSAKSPCIEVCKFDGKTGYCIACLRTREECKDWKKMKDNRRHQILQDRPKREVKLQK
ncbi:DUF1289 domain-containing protein [Undibacterium sp. RTI2.1]|uniref:DUF1289 domain-containing protein n=1 Tax=unclassified Undibacterium TaxID=2630295 RepID=UPI002AB595B7|nr:MULTISPECIES: DUF1289 domain-containing protein [unclassified Undibacterium]MDY7537379.1 DUF1289 domain-containing protein [Undibacterium sp. 5I1]MEB0031234.1 DUF1289 domain-containing protein [Undibacterium sp. RTI2.1]MEB0117614.1 DUF1289 domain-containing protein [Undibacterium sp. RTI2.2]MEB0232022.1 DUF1289 domain-containing protein [Undibacterium sp. 10I3]MEB0259309.1 DUF1289 domain-containing protein [Undibacterium sp. 5I1]